jgi:hypothetical protein
MPRRSRTLETRVITEQDERKIHRAEIQNLLSVVKKASQKMDQVLVRLKEREAVMPYESPIPFRSPFK